MITALADQAERDRLLNDLDTTLFVEAGAGTGKTTSVVCRIVALVEDGRLRMERLVAITFTIAAAGELRVRIRQGLEDAARARPDGDEAGIRCAEAATEVDRARIETIHAFCAALLRMHPLEAGLPPDFEVLAELSATLDIRDRFRQWFGEAAEAPVRQALQHGFILGVTPGRLRELFAGLDANWDLLQSAQGWDAELPATLSSRVQALGQDIGAQIALQRMCHNGDDGLSIHLEGLRPLAQRLARADSTDEALAAVVEFDRSPKLGNRGSAPNWSNGVCKQIKDSLKGLREEATDLIAAASAAVACRIAAALREEVVRYARDRQARGLVSYQDILVRARDLVRDHPEVRAALFDRWDVLVVDEFQDTDPLQAELAFRLSAPPAATALLWTDLPLVPGRLCVVGDPKQSIYRFRRADIAMYRAVEEALCAAEPRARASLQVNFRSGTHILDTVNAVFGAGDGLMAAPESGVQATYVDLVAHAPDIAGSVCVIGGVVDARAAQMWRQEAEATACTIARIVADGWTVDHGRAGGSRPCALSDICILMPSRTNLRNVERALENAKVHYRLESGSLMVATQEVRDLVNCLRAIDDPTDEVALVAALRSPAYGCSDVDLLQHKEAGGRWSYLAPERSVVPRVAAASADLRELHRTHHSFSVPALVEELIARRLLRAVAADDWRPRETLRRQRYVLEQVRALARAGRTTLHDAVDYLERLAADPHYDSVTSDGDGEDCVRVMTIHAAKGLEFPVVLVTGLGRRPPAPGTRMVASPANARVEVQLGAGFATPGWASLAAFEQRMQDAEQVRLLYVALTRARDHLVVSGFRAARQGDKTAAHALHTRLLALGHVRELAIAEAVLPRAAPHAGIVVEMDPVAHRRDEEAWVELRAQRITAFGGLRATTATAVAHEPDAPDAEASSDVAAQRRGRGGTSLGRAVHAVLQLIDLVSLEGVAAHAAAQAANEGIPDRADDVERLVRTACASDAVGRAAAARHWRELPVGAVIDGTIVEGFIDLLYEDPDGRLVVLDYKTDDVAAGGVDARFDRYRLQGGVYAVLITAVTGREVARIEFVFAAVGETRTINDVSAVSAEVRSALRQAG